MGKKNPELASCLNAQHVFSMVLYLQGLIPTPYTACNTIHSLVQFFFFNLIINLFIF